MIFPYIIYNPEPISITMLENLLSLKKECLLDMTKTHLKFKTTQDFVDKLHKEWGEGYRAECSIYVDPMWNLLNKYVERGDVTALLEDEYKDLRRYGEECSAAKLNQLPVESKLKPIKKAHGSQKMTSDTLKTIYNNRLNLKKCVYAHPRNILLDVKQNGLNSKLIEPQIISNNEYDDCFEIMDQDTLAQYSLKYSTLQKPENKKYKRKQFDSKLNKGKQFNVLQTLNQNKGKLEEINKTINKKKK
eukprot:236225_1